jgi:predicted nucleotidyltransferase
MEDTIRLAKTIITEEVERAGCRVLRILLFGSRARGDARPDSDWDFYVVVDRDIPFQEIRKITGRIDLRFVQSGFWGDVFIQSEKVVHQREQNTGYLTYYVLREGVVI